MALRTNYINDVLPRIHIELRKAHAVLEKYGLSALDIIDLCGGIPGPHISNIHVIIVATYSSALSVHILTDQYEIVRNMDFDIGRIDNNYMYVQEKGQGLGTNMFLTQIHTAIRHHFKKIHLTAMGPEDGLDWNGYYFWAELGFENTDTAEYHAWAVQMGREEPSLSELMQSETGRALWKNTGFTWIGNFYLARGHRCMTYLQQYLKRKEIDFLLDA